MRKIKIILFVLIPLLGLGAVLFLNPVGASSEPEELGQIRAMLSQLFDFFESTGNTGTMGLTGQALMLNSSSASVIITVRNIGLAPIACTATPSNVTVTPGSVAALKPETQKVMKSGDSISIIATLNGASIRQGYVFVVSCKNFDTGNDITEQARLQPR